MEKRIQKLRKEKLEEFKVKEIAVILDRIDTIKKESEDDIKKLEDKIDEIKELKFISSHEG